MFEKDVKLFIFNCSNCPKKNAQSKKKDIAAKSICRTCRTELKKNPKGQIAMFGMGIILSNDGGASGFSNN